MRVFLTGATGIVGAELALRLLQAGHEVVALVHRKRDIITNSGRDLQEVQTPGRLVLAQGDVSAPRLNLDPSGFESLSRSDLIVHAAAVTEFGMPESVYLDVNLQGTKSVVSLAEEYGKRLLYVSTAYVCGICNGRAPEQLSPAPPRFGNAYEKSKYLAERAIAESLDDFVIARPSIVVGDSREGKIREFRQIYALVKVLTRGLVRSIPGEFDATLNITPLDFVASALVRIVEQAPDFYDGSVFHLTTERNLTFGDMSEVLAEYPGLEVPRFIPPHAFDPAALPRSEHKIYERIVALYGTYFARRIEFVAENIARLALRPPAGGGSLFRTIIDYAEEARFLGRN